MTEKCFLAQFRVRSAYLDRVKATQRRDPQLQKIMFEVQQLSIPEWKWDMIAMDFISGLTHTSSGYDAIWVIVDRLTKTAHFFPIKKTYSTDRLARLYVNQIVFPHGVPVSIVSD